jgi:hypothetical protein
MPDPNEEHLRLIGSSSGVAGAARKLLLRRLVVGRAISHKAIAVDSESEPFQRDK